MKATSETTTEIKTHVTEALRLLRTLRDEIRVELHLAGMEAQDRWRALEPKFTEAERVGHDVSEATKQVLRATVEEFKAFRAGLAATPKGAKPTDKGSPSA